MSVHQSSIVTDLRYLPLVVVSYPKGEVSDEDVAAFIQGQRDLLARRERFAVLTDARLAGVLKPNQRRMMADWLVESDEASQRCVAAMGIVVNNAMIRGALTAVLWIKQPAFPTKITTTLADSARYCISALEMEGIRVGPRTEDYLIEVGARA